MPRIASRGPAPPRIASAAIVALAILAALLLTLLAAPAAQAQRRVMTVTAAEMTRQAATHFPRRQCLLGLVCLTLSEPRVRLRGSDPRLFVAFRAEPDAGGQPLSPGDLEVAGVPRYDAGQGAFYVDEPSLQRLAFADLPAREAALVADLARGLLAEFFRRTPVWVLDERDPQQALAKLALRDVRVRDGVLQFVVGDDEPSLQE